MSDKADDATDEKNPIGREDRRALRQELPPLYPSDAEEPAHVHPMDTVVDEWFAKHFHGLGAKLDEPLFNHLRAAKEDLKSILAGAHQ